MATKAGLILVNGPFIDVVFLILMLDAFDYSILHFCSALMQFVLAFLALALIDGVTAGQSPLSTSPQEAVSQACHDLASLFPAQVSFPDDRKYQAQQGRYWASNQADYTPSCRVSPTTSDEVSKFVTRFVEFGDDVHFSIASGGHATAYGASNLDAGITLDLGALNSVSLAANASYIDVGTGARWLDVYQVLDPFGLTVAGGRAASVGVGGYLLGGGISLFSSLYGWGADSLESIEVVLANGTQITASNSAHADLFSCLKGGANNFGVATSFRLRTIPTHGPLHISLISYPHGSLPGLLKALANFSRNAHLDPSSASADLSVGYDATLDMPKHNNTVFMLMLVRIASPAEARCPDNDEAIPQLWQPFFEIPSTSVSSFKSSMSGIAELVEMSNPYGFRVYKATLTVRNDPILLHEISTLFTAAFQNYTFAHGESTLQGGMLIQPLTLPHLQYSSKSQARNLMSLEDEEEPLILLSFEIHYVHSTHTAKYTSLVNDLLCAAESFASARNALHPFKYVNYAAAQQDVWEMLFQKGRLREVRDVRSRYDPGEVWETRLEGGFRLPL